MSVTSNISQLKIESSIFQSGFVAAPTSVALSVLSDSSIRITWAYGSTALTGFIVDRSLDGIIYTQITTTGPTITSYTDTGLATLTTYYYRIYAYVSSAYSPPSIAVSGTTEWLFAPSAEALYYGWNNEGLGTNTVKNIQLAYKLQGEARAIVYFLNKNTDAHYDVVDINLVDLTYRQMTGLIGNPYRDEIYMTPPNTGEGVTFNGTGLYMWVLRGTNRGIMGMVRYDGNFGGRVSTDASSMAWVRDNYAEDDYFWIYDSGNYSTIHSSLSSLAAGDLIHYHNGAWVRVLAAAVNYSEFDCYHATASDYVQVTVASGLTAGTHRVGVFCTITRNPLSSANTITPRYNAVSLFSNTTFQTIGAITSYNSYDDTTMVQLIGEAGHWEMSTRIKRNGTAQDSQWIPAHSSINTLTWHSGENIRIWVDGVEASGYRNGSVFWSTITSVETQNVTYAVNTAATSEELMRVTTVYSWNIDRMSISNTYETLIETLATAGYSFMFPWAKAFPSAIFNRFVTSGAERVELPEVLQTQNITNGMALTEFLVYNNTPGSTYEDIALAMKITNIAETNRASVMQAYLYAYGTTYGKLYTPVYNGTVLPVGDEWTTTFEMRVGTIDGLIAAVEAYV